MFTILIHHIYYVKWTTGLNIEADNDKAYLISRFTLRVACIFLNNLFIITEFQLFNTLFGISVQVNRYSSEVSANTTAASVFGFVFAETHCRW